MLHAGRRLSWWMQQRLAAGAAQHTRGSMSRLSSLSSSSLAPPSSSLVAVSEEVQAALHERGAVVALESTIISHGMPYPQNVETARAVEDTVRQAGATPATVAVMNGKLCVGLESDQLEQLGAAGAAARKCSRRDIALSLADGGLGATTVAGTMCVASMVPGIHVFVTGGIGGVHRGAEDSMDVSADLTELGRTPMAVFCAGVKSILDIPRTMEVLETQGVPVVALGQAEVPAFFTPSSGVPAHVQLETTSQVGALLAAHVQAGLQNGVLVTVPYTDDAALADELDACTSQALAEAEAQGVHGKAITPFLLKRINELSQGRSLAANIGLVLNNARVGAAAAVDLATRLSATSATQSPGLGAATAFSRRAFHTSAAAPRWQQAQRHTRALHTAAVACGSGPPVVVGGAVIDVVARASEALILETSNPGVVVQQYGGVGRNVAEAAGRLGAAPELVSVVGTGTAGDALLTHARSAGVSTACVSRSTTGRSATYVAMLNEEGDMYAAVADMDCLDEVTPEKIDSATTREAIENAASVTLDANMSTATLAATVRIAADAGVPVWFEPTSVPKSGRVANMLHLLSVVTPNEDEVMAMSQGVLGVDFTPSGNADADDVSDAEDGESAGGRETVVQGPGGTTYDPATGHGDASLAGGEADLKDASEGTMEDEGATFDLSAKTLAAAQMLLAAMCTPPRAGDAAVSQEAGADGTPLSELRVTGSGLVDGRKHVVVTLGSRGVLWVSCPPLSDEDTLTLDGTVSTSSEAGTHGELAHLMTFFSKAVDMGLHWQILVGPPAPRQANVTGAGDTLLGAAVWAHSKGRPMKDCLKAGIAAAGMAVESEATVPSELQQEEVYNRMMKVQDILLDEPGTPAIE